MKSYFASSQKLGFVLPKFSLFIALALISLSGFSEMTDPPLSVAYLPTTFSAGDTIQIEFSLGESGNEAGPATSFSFVHDYSDEWFKIGAASNITANFDNSWACADGNCEADITVDHQAKKIYVTVSRLDEELQFGAGVIVRLDGIIIEIDEIHARLKAPELIIFQTADKLKVRAPEKIVQLRIVDLSGRIVLNKEVHNSEMKISTVSLGTGVYFVFAKLESSKIPGFKKITIRR